MREDDNPLSQAEKLAELFIKDRKQQVQEVIIPTLANGHFVVSDRYKLSTICYQHAQGLDIQNLIDMQDGLPVPDITFVIDVPAEVAGMRMGKDLERNEHKFEKNLDFLEKIRQNYFKAKELLKDHKIVIIDGNRTPDEVFVQIKDNLNIFLKQNP